MLLDAKPKASRTLPGTVGLGGVGLGIGVVSSFVGIGGGSMSVPFMSWCNIPLKRAIATSAALGWPIAFSGALGYMASGWGRGDLPAYTVGFVYLPAVATLCLITMATAPMGARLAHRLPVAKLKKLFALLMVVMASQFADQSPGLASSPRLVGWCIAPAHQALPFGRVYRPSSPHMASTRALTAVSITIGVPHSREVSPGCLLVASAPSCRPARKSGWRSPDSRSGCFPPARCRAPGPCAW